MAESASAKIQQEASSVIDIETKEERDQACIYKVPYPLRKLNEEAYTPQVISIGPIHHSNENLEMNNYKESYLKGFMDRAEKDIEYLKRILTADVEKGVRQCYEKTFTDHLSSEDFVTMILTDASFIIEFFLRNRLREWTSEDWIVLKPWLTARILQDFILLENQLPFFIIERLYDHVGFPSRSGYPSFVELTFEYFESYNKQKMRPHGELKILHFLDLLRNFFLPPDHGRLPKRENKMVEHMYSATQLAGVGVTFEVDLSRNCLLELDLDLRLRKRVLKIPRFTLDNDTELYVRNLLALEQCHYPNATYVTDHFILLDFLINRKEDLDLLRQKRIVVSEFDSKHATNFINNLGKSISTCSSVSSKYYDICIKLKEFYEEPDWPEYLRRNYFSTTLWQAASIITILTSIQTGCSLFSAIKGR